jgi:hypothetical protein
MSIRLLIMFPYSAASEPVFRGMADVLSHALARGRALHTSREPPIVVLHVDTERAGNYRSFEEHLATTGRSSLIDKYSVLRVWSVDTCQMWLAGWGKVLDDNYDPKRSFPPDEAVVQIPGDLTEIRSRNPLSTNPLAEFLRNLEVMCLELAGADLVVGDFDVYPQKAKQLIDTYGTLPLLYNWFPEVARKLRVVGGSGIGRPRSEFIAASTRFLEHFITTKEFRKFAYEETLALLIQAILDVDGEWRIDRHDIGIVEDYGGDRGFREAIDQIERTERMLKVLWRRDHVDARQGFPFDEFEDLDARSTAIRRNALICCRNFLL